MRIDLVVRPYESNNCWYTALQVPSEQLHTSHTSHASDPFITPAFERQSLNIEDFDQSATNSTSVPALLV